MSLDLSRVRVMTTTKQGSVLSLKPEPVVMEACCELLGIWDGIRRFNDDSAEGYSGQTR
jgi:hypothetical protein